jgi:hypothetical protein
MAQKRRALLPEVVCICVLPLGAEDLAAQRFQTLRRKMAAEIA